MRATGVLVLVLLACGSLPAQGEADKLVKLAKGGNTAVLERQLREAHPGLFDTVLAGLQDPTLVPDLLHLASEVPEEMGSTGLVQIVERVQDQEATARKTWLTALGSCLEAEDLLASRRAAADRVREALEEAEGAAAAAQGPWIRARGTVTALLGAALEHRDPVARERLEEARKALSEHGDAGHLMMVLDTLSESLGGDGRVREARAVFDEARSLQARMGLEDPDPPVSVLSPRAALSMADALFRQSRTAEALPLLEDLAAELAGAHLTGAARHAELLRALALVASRKGRKGASLALRKLRDLRREKDPQRMAWGAFLGVRAVRLSGRAEEAAEQATFFEKALHALESPPGTGLELRYEHGLCLRDQEMLSETASHMQATGTQALDAERPALARSALQVAAWAELHQDHLEQARRLQDLSRTASLGHPELDRVQETAFETRAAAALLAAGHVTEAAGRLERALQSADELGLPPPEMLLARDLRDPASDKALLQELLEILPYHRVGARSRSLVYQVLERQRLTEVADLLGSAPQAPQEVLERLTRTREKLDRLFACLRPYGRGCSVEEGRDILRARRQAVSSTRRSHPRLALARFPTLTPVSRLTNLLTRHRAALLYPCVLEQGGFTYVLAGSNWSFQGLSPKLDLVAEVEDLRELLGGEPDIAAYTACAGRVHDALLKPVEDVLKPVRQILVVPDPRLGPLDPGVLVPSGMKTGSWSTLPLVARKQATALVPAAAMLKGFRTVASQGIWGRPRHMATVALGPVDPIMGHMEVARLDRTRHERGRSLAAVIGPEGALAGLFDHDGWLHAGPRVEVDTEALDALEHFAPNALVACGPLKGAEPFPWAAGQLLRGTEAVVVRVRELPDDAARALSQHYWRGLLAEKRSPALALQAARLDALMGRLGEDGMDSPAVWGALQVVLSRP